MHVWRSRFRGRPPGHPFARSVSGAQTLAGTTGVHGAAGPAPPLTADRCGAVARTQESRRWRSGLGRSPAVQGVLLPQAAGAPDGRRVIKRRLDGSEGAGCVRGGGQRQGDAATEGSCVAGPRERREG